MKHKCSAIIAAAGIGRRMGGPVPKQFLEIGDKPVLAYTLNVFEMAEIIDEIIIVTGTENIEYCKNDIVKRYGYKKVRNVISGGKTRCFSVFNGMKACAEDTAFVFIHDGVRSMITEDIIRRGHEEVLKYDSAVASIVSKDTVRITDNEGNVILTPDRETVRCIQTPQIFSFEKLYDAYSQMTEEEMTRFTDDAMVWERYRPEKLHLYYGSTDNIKITTPEDMTYAIKILEERNKQNPC